MTDNISLDQSIEPSTKIILDQYPFLSYGKYLDQYYIGIIQNADNLMVSMYRYDRIPEKKDRQKFLDLGHKWWWQSNRKIPIDMFLKNDFSLFRPYMNHFSSKEYQHIYGPSVSLQEINTKRIKRRQIVLVREVPKN